jgi:hypothetical protein
VLLADGYPTFCRAVMPALSRVRQSKKNVIMSFFLDCLVLAMRTLRPSEMLETTHPMEQDYIPKDMNPLREKRLNLLLGRVFRVIHVHHYYINIEICIM